MSISDSPSTVTLKKTLVDEIKRESYPPLNSLPSDLFDTVSFHIPPVTDAFLDISNVYLYLRAQFLNADTNAALTGPQSEQMAPICYLGSTMWKNVEVFFNNVQVYDAQNNYAYISYLMTLLYASREAKETYLTSALYYPEAAGFFDNFDVQADGNEAARIRSTAVDNSKVFELYTRLSADIFNQSRLLLNNVDVVIRLTPHTAQFFINQAGLVPVQQPNAAKEPVPVKMKIIQAELYVNRVHLTETEMKQQEAKLAREPYLYPFVQTRSLFFQHPNNTTIFDREICQGVLPERVYLLLLEESKYRGNYKKNSLEFEHFSIKSMLWTCAGRLIPTTGPLTMDIKNKQFTRAYHSLFENVHNDRLAITPSQYAAGYCIFCVDLTRDSTADEDESINRQHTGALRLQMTFEKAPTETLVVLIIAEYERVLSINKDRIPEILPETVTE
jgi:hypothetical protein